MGLGHNHRHGGHGHGGHGSHGGHGEHDGRHGVSYGGGHGHSIGTSEGHQQKKLTVVLILTLIYMAVEAIGGYYANSLALTSDATHMFTDAGALGLTMISFYFSKLPPSPKNSFGWHRAEILGAFVNGIFLFVLAIWIIFQAISRIRNPEVTQPMEMIVISSGGLLLNVFSGFYLLKDSQENLAVKGAMLHILGDALGSIGSIVAGVFIYTNKWYVFDPAVSLLVAGLILLTSSRFILETLHILLQGVPGHLNLDEIRAFLLKIEGVDQVHRLHLWSLSSQKVILTVHVVTSLSDDTHLLEKVRGELREKFGIAETTIQLEKSTACE